jgi:hypothetical protein
LQTRDPGCFVNWCERAYAGTASAAGTRLT